MNNGGCNQICIDTFQSYECSCRAGYSLSNDGYTCIGKLIIMLGHDKSVAGIKQKHFCYHMYILYHSFSQT